MINYITKFIHFQRTLLNVLSQEGENKKIDGILCIYIYKAWL